MHFVSGVLATVVACASLVSAGCGAPSMSCEFLNPVPPGFPGFDAMCNAVCKKQGDSGGSCEQPPGCTYVCTCFPPAVPAKKRNRGSNDGDEPLKKELDPEVEAEFAREIMTYLVGDSEVESSPAIAKLLDGSEDVEVAKFLDTIATDPDLEEELNNLLPTLKDSLSDEEESPSATSNADDGIEKVEARSSLQKRSIACPAPWVPGYFCEAHCLWIGKSGGACNGIDNVCICYD